MLRGVCLEVVCSHPLLDSLEAAGKEGRGGGGREWEEGEERERRESGGREMEST